MRRLSSRWFFDPKIFFKIQPTISWLISARFRHYQLLAPMAREVLRDSLYGDGSDRRCRFCLRQSKTVTACSHGPVGRPEVSKLKLRWDRLGRGLQLMNRFRESSVAARPLSARDAGNGFARFQYRQIVAGAE